MGTLMHEVLHKHSVGGGTQAGHSHNKMCEALDINRQLQPVDFGNPFFGESAQTARMICSLVRLSADEAKLVRRFSPAIGY
jgi:hypothetical protein